MLAAMSAAEIATLDVKPHPEGGWSLKQKTERDHELRGVI
jgi:predicted cupin superfamily sugar epimerase